MTSGRVEAVSVPGFARGVVASAWSEAGTQVISVPAGCGVLVGGPVRRSRVGGMWQTAARKVGLPGVTFHALRHHYASLLIRSGCSVKAVQEALGHATAAETLNTYAHLWPSDHELTRAAVDPGMGGAG